MPLGETIKSMRESRGMTQQDLADLLYVTRQTVSRWESGSRCPDLIMAKKIAVVFEITLDELVPENDAGDCTPPRRASSDIKKILASIFVLVLGVWFLACALVSNAAFFAVLGMIAPFLAVAMFIFGYFSDGSNPE